MLHSSNRIGRTIIQKFREDMDELIQRLPNEENIFIGET